MNILICCEFFFPSIGGVQEVVKQIATRLADHEHTVTIATTSIPERSEGSYEKIEIKGFKVFGNYTKGFYGEIDSYRSFIINGDYDLLFIYAAQQWTFDALIGFFDKVKAKKVFVPCGFSGLYDKFYANYFKLLPSILKHFDALIFHTKNYRDYEFAKSSGLDNLYLIPNGADYHEFAVPSLGFREKYHISLYEKVLLTVGSLNPKKGHLEVLEAFCLMRFSGPITLVINGNNMTNSPKSLIDRVKKLNFTQIVTLLFSPFILVKHLRQGLNFGKKLASIANKVNQGKYGLNKKVLILDMKRADLIKCYFESDIFVFASHIEYSPLVLFEAAAAGLPFITVDVGNAREIAHWTDCGVLCPSKKDKNGYTRVKPKNLAEEIDLMLTSSEKLDFLGNQGRKFWATKYNWDVIYYQYDKVFSEVLGKSSESQNE